MKKVLITGASTGLGKFLHNSILGSISLDRNIIDDHYNEHYDLIIHCASSSDHFSKNIIYESESLLNNILNINHDIFVFISTIDIYREPYSFYSKSKLNCEKILKNHPHCLILRSSMILGPTMRDNHITKIKRNENLSLSGNSTFNYISMNNFKVALSYNDLLMTKGIFDFVSTDCLDLNNVKKLLNSSSITGSYIYDTPTKFENPIFKTFPNLTFSSQQALEDLIND